MKIELDIASSQQGKRAIASAVNPANELIGSYFLGALFQYKIFHWQTFSYSQHKAFDEIFEELEESVDEFIEKYMGKYGRVNASKGHFSLNADNISGTNFLEFTNLFIDFLVHKLPGVLDQNDTDLLNVRDDILGDLNRLKYLLTLQ